MLNPPPNRQNRINNIFTFLIDIFFVIPFMRFVKLIWIDKRNFAIPFAALSCIGRSLLLPRLFLNNILPIFSFNVLVLYSLPLFYQKPMRIVIGPRHIP